MAKSQFYKAAEKVQRINLAKLELETLTQMTIRELRGIVAKINKEEKGWVFCKATLGKPVSYFKKNELLNIIWSHLTLKRYAPKSKRWEEKALTPNNRIMGLFPEPHSHWTISIGFNEYGEALVLQKWLHEQQKETADNNSKEWWEISLPPKRCTASVIRDGKRTGYKFELKVWELASSVLRSMVKREQERIMVG